MAAKQENSHKSSSTTPLKTKQQIADELNIHVHTLQRRLEKANIKIPRGLIGIELQNLIYEVLNCSGWDEKG